jgi:hypothetical protein
MLYSATNELDHFQFHDAEIKEITFNNSDMLWTVSGINATTQNTQNENTKDMCIEQATMKFDNTEIKSIVLGAYTVHDSKGNLIEDAKAITVKPEEYSKILSKPIKNHRFIYGMDSLLQNPNGTYDACFHINSGTRRYYFTFSFSCSTVEWNNFSGEAWYEHPKWKKQ